MVHGKSLDRSDLRDDPLELFSIWFDEGKGTLVEPYAMALASADPSGRPSLRMVLLKKLDERGFIFATNYGSRKGRELDGNPAAALLFYWPELERQIRITGTVRRAGEADSDAIFMARPRPSRLAATASEQSRPIASREDLEGRVQHLEDLLAGGEVTRPAYWGGYLVVPEEYEFWQGGPNRLHDRFVYRKVGEGWEISRLQP